MSTVKFSWRTLVALFGALVLILGMAVSPASAVTLDEGSSSSGQTALTQDAEATPTVDATATSEASEAESLSTDAPEAPKEVASPDLQGQDDLGGITDPGNPADVRQLESPEPVVDAPITVAPMNVSVGSISGTVTVPAGVDPQRVSASLISDAGILLRSVMLSADGTYTVPRVNPGSYKMRFESYDDNVAPLWWEDASDFDSAGWVTVEDGQAISGIDVTLENGGSISGVVAVPEGVNVQDGYVTVYTTLNKWAGSSEVAADGSYTVGGLESGSYKVQVRSYGANASQRWWDDASDFQSATLVDVQSGQDTPSINVTLGNGGSISGTVTVPEGIDMQNVNIEVYDNSNRWVSYQYPNVDGSYTVAGLDTGSYRVKFDVFGADIATQWWDGASNFASATPINVTDGQDTENIDVTLSKGGSISGEVSALEGVNPWSYYVGVYDSNGDEVRFVYLNSAGSYRVDGLAAGTYKVKFDSLGAAVASQWWEDASDFESATPIEVEAGQVVSNINALHDGRVHLDGTVPTIDGTVKVGGTLVVDPGAWTSDATLSYQWFADGVAISAATNSTLTLTAAEADKKITVKVTGSKSGYTSTSKTSKATVKVTKSAQPTISGDTKVASVLTAVPGAWTAGATFKYQWFADGVAISGATKSTLKLALADLGKTFSVEVTGSKSGYAKVVETSAATGKVTEGEFSAPTPTISGTIQVGKVLNSARGYWGSDVTFEYQWFADGVAINGATNWQFTVKPEQVGKKLTVRVTGSKPGYATTSKTSAATVAVAPGALTAKVPTISGTIQVGKVLNSARGVWTSGSTFAYQWFADGEAIYGATNWQFTVKPEQAGKKLTVRVTGSKPGYATTSKTSAATVAVAPGALTAPVPTISGTVQVGKVLSSARGYWGSNVTFEYQWFANGVAIDGATNWQFTVKPEQAGKKLTVRVTGSKPGYTTTSKTSAATAAVTSGEIDAPIPTISGTAQVGLSLGSARGYWGEDVTFEYQWLANGVAIEGATNSYYMIKPEQVGKKITLQVTGSKDGFVTTSRTSAATDTVAPGVFTAPTPTISGTIQVGKVLNSARGYWGEDVTYEYQWFADGAAIDGATNWQFTVKPEQLGMKLTVQVTGSKAGYVTASKMSEATVEVAARPMTSSIPSISGIARVGNTLGSTRGSWTSGSTFEYQWFADGVAIDGATNSTLTLTSAEAGKKITVAVTGSKFGYVTTTETSQETVAVAE